MKTYFKFILLFLTLCQPHWVSAHAVITDYSLKITPIRANSPANIDLLFNSKIELGLSQIFLVSKGDKHTLLKAVAGTKQGQVIINIPSMEAGNYALRFKVFAADGHLTEDVIHFSISN
jgi:methionine-rich copper-binding protein CopC